MCKKKHENEGLPFAEPYAMKIKHAAAYFGDEEQTIRNWIHEGKLLYGKHYYKNGRAVRIVVSEYREFVRERRP